MPFQQDESMKILIEAIGKMIDARLQTFAINLKSEMQEEFKKIRKEMATKDDIKNLELRIRNDMATKGDIKRLEEKMEKRDIQFEKRFHMLETA